MQQMGVADQLGHVGSVGVPIELSFAYHSIGIVIKHIVLGRDEFKMIRGIESVIFAKGDVLGADASQPNQDLALGGVEVFGVFPDSDIISKIWNWPMGY
jgi:hypothetical protein